ncbi:MAG TPA: hypothetical protein VH702_00050 [Vicinamibacterales bacterium]|jgi:hypothetical protein
MKGVIGYVMAAIVLALIGGALLIASRLDRGIADSQENLVTQKFDQSLATFENAERYYGYASRLPWIGSGPLNDVRARRATAQYWQRQYVAIVPEGTEPVASVDVDNIALQMVVANASFRKGQATSKDKQTTLDALDTSINAYLTVLKNTSRHENAAYNFEYLVRLRQEVEKGRRKPGESDGDDGPEGRGGGPTPEQGNTNDFKVYIPLESEELQQGSGSSGKAAPTEKKG